MAGKELRNLGVVAISFLVGSVASLRAQSNWQQAQTPSPGIRVNYPLSTDTVRQRILLFGGVENSNTYEWDGNGWQQRNPSVVPGWRHGNCIAFDPIRNEQVMFGGGQGSNYLLETWIWNGSNWVQRFPQTSPPGRRDASMVFDEVRNQVVLYGGYDLGGLRSDMWAWDGTNWSEIPLSTSPGPRYGSAAAYDRLRRQFVLFGGSGPNGPLNDTWSWDGNSWQMNVVSSAPNVRINAGMAFHPGYQRIVLFGGEVHSPLTLLADTWSWDGSTWTLEQPAISPCAHAPYEAAFDPVNSKVLIYNGHPWAYYCGTWLFDATPAVPGSYATLGSGCAGSGGVPSLANVNGSVPRIGRTLNVRIAQLPSVATVCIPFFGFNNATWNGMTLPLEMRNRPVYPPR